MLDSASFKKTLKTIWDGHSTGSQDTKGTAAQLICLTSCDKPWDWKMQKGRPESVNGGMVKLHIRSNVLNIHGF